MDLVAGDAREIVLALSIDDIAAFDDPDRFVAHLPLGGGLDPTWLDLFSEAVRSVTEQRRPGRLPRRADRARGRRGERRADRRARRRRLGRRRSPASPTSSSARSPGRWIDLLEEELGPPAARGEALDPRPDRADRRLRAPLATARPRRRLRLGVLSDRMATFDERARDVGHGRPATSAPRRSPTAIRSAVALDAARRGRSRSGPGPGCSGWRSRTTSASSSSRSRRRGMLEVAQREARGPRTVPASSADRRSTCVERPAADAAVRPRDLAARAPPPRATRRAALAAIRGAAAARRPARAVGPRRRGREVPRRRCRGHPSPRVRPRPARGGRSRRLRASSTSASRDGARRATNERGALPAVPAHGHAHLTPARGRRSARAR